MPRAFAPHCDQRVLHAPGVCKWCDEYPDWQELRVIWGLNFTGENKLENAIDPSQVDRDLETINMWPGNRPS